MIKKVLLRNRKKHTARCVASTRSAVLPWGGRSTPVLSGGGGVPHSPILAGGYPSPVLCVGWGGVPQSYPGWETCPGVPPSWEWVPPWPGLGYPPPPSQNCGTPGQDWGNPPGKDLGPETWERTWNWGVPTVDRQTDACENITFPSYYYAGGPDSFRYQNNRVVHLL